MELTKQEKAILSKHVARIAYKASTSWTSLISELNRIVNSKHAKEIKNNSGVEMTAAAIRYCTAEITGQDYSSG
jgi:hypothetical protein